MTTGKTFGAWARGFTWLEWPHRTSGQIMAHAIRPGVVDKRGGPRTFSGSSVPEGASPAGTGAPAEPYGLRAMVGAYADEVKAALEAQDFYPALKEGQQGQTYEERQREWVATVVGHVERRDPPLEPTAPDAAPEGLHLHWAHGGAILEVRDGARRIKTLDAQDILIRARDKGLDTYRPESLRVRTAVGKAILMSGSKMLFTLEMK